MSNIAIFTESINLSAEFPADKTVVFVDPLEIILDEMTVGQNFTISVKVFNVNNLYGIDLQFGWNSTVLKYVNHTKMIPVETYPDGILHSPTIPVHNDVDESASMPGSAPGTMYWLAEASMAPANTFNGTGIAFNMTFTVKKHPIGMDADIYINITSSTLAHVSGSAISHNKINAHIILHARPQPAGPTIEVSSVTYKGTVPYTFQANVSILNLNAYWDLAGYDLQLTYEPEILQATEVVIDPDGWFESFWPGGIFIVKQEIDNTVGRVWMTVLGLPDLNGTHIAPYGSATLFRINFTALASGPLKIITEPPRYLAGYPHPERPEPPYDGGETSVPIPYNATDGMANIVGVTQHTISGYTITTESNSSISSIFFQQGVPMLYFNATGVDGHTGYCNITIPKDFMWSTIPDGWFVFVNGRIVQPEITSDGTNTYIYFSYNHSKLNILVITTNVVPEFSTPIFIIAMLTLAGTCLMLTRKSTKKRTLQNLLSPFFNF